MPVIAVRPSEDAVADAEYCAQLGYIPSPDLGQMETSLLGGSGEIVFFDYGGTSALINPAFFLDHVAVLDTASAREPEDASQTLTVHVPDKIKSLGSDNAPAVYAPLLTPIVPLHMGVNWIEARAHSYTLELMVEIGADYTVRAEYAARADRGFKLSDDAELVLTSSLQRAFSAFEAPSPNGTVSRIALDLPRAIVEDFTGRLCDAEPSQRSGPWNLINDNVLGFVELIDFAVTSSVPARLKVNDLEFTIGSSPTRAVFRDQSAVQIPASLQSAGAGQSEKRLVRGVRVVADGYFEYVGSIEGMRRPEGEITTPTDPPPTRIELFALRAR